MIGSTTDQYSNSWQPPRTMRILVTDDNATNRKLLGVLLEVKGHAVVEADNGVAALRVLEHNHVDAVISDVLMPEMEGCRLCYEIRKSPKLKTLPFIVYTASYVSQSEEKVAMPIRCRQIHPQARVGQRRRQWSVRGPGNG